MRFWLAWKSSKAPGLGEVGRFKKARWGPFPRGTLAHRAADRVLPCDEVSQVQRTDVVGHGAAHGW